MSRGYKPERWCESLPHLYLNAGVLSIVWLRNPFAALSSSLLTSTGAAVSRIRRRFEHAPLAHARVPAAGTLRGVPWQSEFETGHAVIDEHHRALFASCNELIDDIQTDKATSVIELRVYELLWAFEAHCEAEYKLLARAGKAPSDDELDAYEGSLSDAKLLRESYHEGALTMAELARFVVYELLFKHVLGDQKLMGVI